MAIGFPTNIVVAIIAAMIGASTGAWFSLAYGLRQLPVATRVLRRWRWGAAIVLLTWLLVVLALAVNPPGRAVLGAPYVVAFLGLGMLAGLLPLLLSPTFRQIIRAIPATWLVGIHAIRLLGFLFLALMDMRLLPAEFALPAGYGDITIGLLALGMVYLLAQRKPYARALGIGWNLLGLLDFAGALTTGILYVGPFAAHVAASGVSRLYVNYVLIVPSFGVPLYTLLHIYSLFQLVSARGGKTTPNREAPRHPPVFPSEQPSVHP
jgi:hypothetical protein